MKSEKIYFENQRQKIEGILYKPENKTDSVIILVHGFTGSRDGPGGLFSKLAKKLVSKNFAVLKFNFRFTTDDFSEFHKMTIKGEVSDLKLIINEISRKYKKISLLGESIGGTISILSCDERIKCLVLWYPSVFQKETDLGKRFFSKEATQELAKTGFIKGRKSNGREYKIGKEFVEELKTLAVIPWAEKIHSPTLIIHGENDKVVPFSHSEKLFQILKAPKKLEKIKDICHAWKNEDGTTDYNLEAQQKAIQLTIEWFEKWLK
jgi:dienelactone hydrolase